MEKSKPRWFYRLVFPFQVMVLVVCLAGLVAPWLQGAHWGVLQILPGFMPLMIPVLAIQIPWWWKRNRWGSGLALLSLACCGFVLSQDLSFHQAKEPEKADLKVLSMNVHFFDFNTEKAAVVVDFIKKYDPDIICFQEFRNLFIFYDKTTLEYFMKETGMPYGQFATAPSHKQGVAMISKYPFLETDTLFTLKDQTNSGMLAVVKLPFTTTQVASVHLSSFQIVRVLDPEKNMEERGRYLYDRFQRVTNRQQSQIASILAQTSARDYPSIICGDFNATAHSRVMHPLLTRFQDSFRESGKGLGYTYPLAAGFGLRIDYALSSREWKPIYHQVLPEMISDHQAIMVHYRYLGD